jgi:protein-disulfide isomerase/uncharacterized membrane protein
MKSKALLTQFLLFLAALGSLVALVLTYHHFRPDTSLGCGADGKGCASVLESAYSRVGPIPTSLFGFGMYVTLIFLGLRRLKALRLQRDVERQAALVLAPPTPEETAAAAELPPASDPISDPTPSLPDYRPLIDRLGTILWGLALVGFGTSLWLQYVSLFEIKSICPWCLSSATLVTLIFLICSIDQAFVARKLDGEQKLLIGVGSFIFLMMAFMGGPIVYRQYRLVTDPNSVERPPAEPPWPKDQIPVSAMNIPGRDVLGNPKAPLLIVEFADYQCAHCRKAKEGITQILRTKGNYFRFMFRNFPIGMIHRWSFDAAMAVEAAHMQGKFWRMNEMVFAIQDQMNMPEFNAKALETVAEQAGLDMKRFRQDIQNPEIKKRIQTDIDTAKRAGLEQTPTFYVVTKDKVYPLKTLKDLQEAIEDTEHPMYQGVQPVPPG